MSSIFTISILQSALELGFIYSLVVLALFISFTILNIADLSTDGCFTLGCAVAATVTLSGHPLLALLCAVGAVCFQDLLQLFYRQGWVSNRSLPVLLSIQVYIRSTLPLWAFLPM